MSDTLSALQNLSIVFVGGGNMATALIDGLLTAKKEQNLAVSIGVIETDSTKADFFAKKGVSMVLYDNAKELLQTANVVVLAVKPQVMAEVCAGIIDELTDKLIISVAAGLSLEKLSTMTGVQRIVRTMPNLPATVGFGATGLYANVNDQDKAIATAVMGASGVTVWVKQEDDLHTVTAVAGSAPAYFFYVLEAMIDKAVAMGLDPASAHALAVQTMQGAAIMAKEGDPSDLRAKVTSKGGTTHAAITYLQDKQVGEHFAGAMQACSDRSVELGS